MKKRYDLLPVSMYDLAGMETWFSEKAARGLHLVSLGAKATFEKGAPRRAVYRVEAQPNEGTLNEERLEMYQDFGWEYVCSIKKLFIIWRSYEDAPTELHTDPVLEAALLEPLYQQNRTLILLMPVLMIAAVVMGAFALFGHPQPLLYAVEVGTQLQMILVLLLDLFLVRQLLRDYLASRRLIRRMKDGQPRQHKRKLSWADQYVQKGLLALALLGLLLNAFSLWNITRDYPVNLAEYTGALPTVTLTEMENDPALDIDRTLVQWGNTSISRSHIRFEFSNLTTVQAEINEEGEVSGRQWNDHSGRYRPRLSTTYYQLRLGFLAKPLLEDMLADQLEYSLYEEVSVEQLHDAPFDQAYLVRRTEESQILLARLGGRVVAINYYGYADLAVHYEAIAQRMAAFVYVKPS